MVMETLNNWFNKNSLSLHFEKIQFTHFAIKNNMPDNLQIGVDNKILPSVTYIKFLGLTIHNSSNWIKHIKQLTTKPGKACNALLSLKQYLPTQTW
jgi:hypothetical protein